VCPTCGSADAAPELDKDHMRIVRCRACDLVYVSPTFDEAHYNEVYASTEYQDIVRDLGIKSHEYRVQRFGTERVDLMARHLTASRPRYLDVGCSTGFVVEAARDRGWEAVGIDLNPSAVEFGRAAASISGRWRSKRATSRRQLRCGIAVRRARASVRSGPHAAGLHPAARAGRHLFMYVPNYDSASRLLMGKDAHFIWPTPSSELLHAGHDRRSHDPEGLSTEYVATEGLDIVDYLWYRREVQASGRGLARLPTRCSSS
jgi:SAM-dependent methyltransferase